MELEHHIRETIEIIDALSPEDRRAVLRHYHDEMRAPEYLEGGGMASGTMTMVEGSGAAPASGPGR
jgi:hypothetical protein